MSRHQGRRPGDHDRQGRRRGALGAGRQQHRRHPGPHHRVAHGRRLGRASPRRQDQARGDRAAARNVAGTLDASAPKGGNGGSIETSGDHVKIADGAVIKTSAASRAGRHLADRSDRLQHRGEERFRRTTSGIGAATLDNSLNGDRQRQHRAASDRGRRFAGNGDINVDAAVELDDPVDNAHADAERCANNININAPITATRTNAGLALNCSGATASPAAFRRRWPAPTTTS